MSLNFGTDPDGEKNGAKSSELVLDFLFDINPRYLHYVHVLKGKGIERVEDFGEVNPSIEDLVTWGVKKEDAMTLTASLSTKGIVLFRGDEDKEVKNGIINLGDGIYAQLDSLENGRRFRTYSIRGFKVIDMPPVVDESPRPVICEVNGVEIRHSNSGRNTLSNNDVRDIYRMFSAGESISSIAEKKGVLSGTIQNYLSQAELIYRPNKLRELLEEKGLSTKGL